jgi:hypothetical protein
MSALADLQRQFQECILNGDPAILRSIESAQNVDAATRLNVYSQAYRLRLTEALANNFPRLCDWLGAEAFAGIADAYFASHPSHFRSIRWVGAELAACLELSHPDEPWLADLAQWEWALAAAFDAADAAPLTETDFATTAPERWPALRFQFHPAARVVHFETNAPAVFKALATRFRSLDESEHRALDRAFSGAAFDDICDALCETLAPEDVPMRAAGLLKGWIADGLIVGVRD